MTWNVVTKPFTQMGATVLDATNKTEDTK